MKEFVRSQFKSIVDERHHDQNVHSVFTMASAYVIWSRVVHYANRRERPTAGRGHALPDGSSPLTVWSLYWSSSMFIVYDLNIGPDVGLCLALHLAALGVPCMCLGYNKYIIDLSI